MKNNNEIKELCKHWKKEDWDKIKKKDIKSDFCILKCLEYVLRFLRFIGIVNFFYLIINYIRIRFCKINFATIEKQFQNGQDILIIFSLTVLLKLLFFCPISQNCYILWLGSFLIIWRLAEILVVQLSIIFLAKENIIETASFPRSILLFIINVSEVITIYAILYLSHGAIGYCYNQVIQKPFEALYFSIITISTTGFGDIIPINGRGRILVFSEIAIGILLLVVFFGIFISKWKSKDDRFYQLLRKVYKQNKKILNLKI